MKILRTIAASALLAVITNLSPLLAQTKPPQPAAPCAPVNGWNLVCGAQNPEDLVPIPGTRWIIASGMKEGAGIKLVDTDAKTLRPFYTGQPAQQRPDKKQFPNCPGAAGRENLQRTWHLFAPRTGAGALQALCCQPWSPGKHPGFHHRREGIGTFLDLDRVRSHAQRK